jgi:hypothetical protein
MVFRAVLCIVHMRLSESIRVGSLIGWAALSTLAGGCHQAPWLVVAQKGSLPELKQAVDQGRKQNRFNREAVVDLAEAILEREIQSATDPDGEALLGRLSDCALALETPLSKRARRHDETAGAALFALVEAGWHMPPDEWADASRSESGARRAAAALDTQAPERWAIREKLLNDADVRVRRAALQSSIAAPAREHWDTEIGILRQDPDVGCRQLAAKAIGIWGGDQAVTVLSDAWARAETPLRLGILSAFAQARTFAYGGRQRLVAIARSEPGIVGVLAAADLAQGSSDAQSYGQARITRSLEFGSTEDRALAIATASWSLGDQAQLLLRLGLDTEPETRIAALQRWLEQPAHRWPAITWLRMLAEGDTSSAIHAREVLAQQGDQTAILGLRLQLSYAKWESRGHAARNLWSLGDASGFARALADDAPEVRLSAACLAIATPTKGR